MSDLNLVPDAMDAAVVNLEARDLRRSVNPEQTPAYWRKQLAGSPAILELPTDRSRLPIQSFRADHELVQFPQSLRDRLQALCTREDVSPFVLFLAAFQTLLMRHARQEDIVVGTSLQDVPFPSDIAGPIIAIRTDMSGDPTFRELLHRVSKVVDEAREHQEISWERLVEALQPEQDPSRHPIFQAKFSLTDSPAEPGFQLDRASGPEALNVDLHLHLHSRSGALTADFAYAADLFDTATIRRMAGHFQRLLEGVVAYPDEHISGLPILTAAEREQLLAEWNNTSTNYPRKACVHHLFEAQVARTPDSVAVVFENSRLTYRELNARGNQLARYLVKLGVGPYVLVGICVERSLEMIVGLLGILKAGGAYVPVDPAFPADRIAFMLEDAEAPVLLTQGHLVSGLPKHKAALVRLDADWSKIAGESTENLPTRSKAKDLVYTMYTSGSTGKPKGVQIPHRAVVNFLVSMAQTPGMTAQDRLLAVTTLSFDIAGLEIYLPLTLGASVEIASRNVYSDGNQLLAKLKSSGATVMQATPATWRMLLEAGWQSSPGLKILVGGEAVPVKLADELMRRADSVWNMYGPTETTIWSTVRKFRRGEATVSIGRPIANTEVFILDKLLQPVPIGVAGELLIGGDGLARGYLKRPELTADKFIAHPFSDQPGARLYKTGDLARYLPNGEIEFLGRIDHQVKIRGFRIELGEIESVLRQHPGVSETVVVAREDVPGDKRVVAYFLSKTTPAPRLTELRSFLKLKLPEYMIPSIFVSLTALPLTPNGKVDRKALPLPQAMDIRSEDAYVAPRNEAEAKMARIWEDVLRTKPIGVKHDFFDLGGHSLLAARLMSLTAQQFHVNLPIATLFQARTVEQLTRILYDQGWSPTWSPVVAIQTHGDNPPFFCVHGIGGNVLGFYDLSRNLGPSHPFYGLQAQGLDGKIPPHTRVEDMAALYVREMRKIQPQGPYFLGGLSFGGAIALEMAQQLHAQGQQIGLLALFDTFAGHSKSKSSLLLKFFALPLRRKIAYLEQKTRFTINGIRRWIYRLSLPRVLKDVRAAHQVAHSNYVMRQYPGIVTLFIPFDPSLRSSEDPRAEWQNFAAGIEVYEIPGDHDSLLDEPHVQVLAYRLAACIAASQPQGQQVQQSPIAVL